MADLLIIGNGIAGITCARHVRKKDSKIGITIVSYETEHFFSRTALMYLYMGHMKYEHTKPYEDFFWKKNRLELVYDKVLSVDTKNKKINLKKGEEIHYNKLVIATGSSSNMPDWPGIHSQGVQGLYSLPDLEEMERNTKNIRHAVVAGGGLIGIEMAEMLHSRGIHTTLIIREKAYWTSVLPLEEAQMVSRHIREHGILLREETEVAAVLADQMGKVMAITTKEEEEIQCAFLGVAIGVHPNIGFLKNSDVQMDKGILVNSYFETNVPDVFAIGDCAEFHEPLLDRKKLEQIWYTGRMHGETLAHTLTGNRTQYQPSAMFNSAKFMDIEYQTYGRVPAEPEGNITTFYWEDAKHNLAFRLWYRKDSKVVIGMHSLGIRLRHIVADTWLQQGNKTDAVISGLNDLLFDPEFFPRHQVSILSAYNKHFGTQIMLQKKSWKRIFGLVKD